MRPIERGRPLYLINIVFGALSLGPTILVTHDVAATAHNIQAHELLYRLGLTAHIVVTVTNIPMAVIFYELFKVVKSQDCAAGCFLYLGRAQPSGHPEVYLVARTAAPIGVPAGLTGDHQPR